MTGRLEFGRTTAAAVLILVAVAMPSGVWLVVGSGDLDRRARLEQERVYDFAYKKGIVLAERLATELELLREDESRRAFYHYQNLYHDPRAAAEGVSVAISPLAEGSNNPLIEAHFQVDDAGNLTLPTLNDEFPDLGLHSSQAQQCALRGQLEDIVFFSTLESSAASPSYRRRDTVAGFVDGGSGSVPDEIAVEVLTPRSWAQHLMANALYADLKYHRTSGDGELYLGLAELDRGDGRVEVKVGPFSWYTLPVDGEPGLVALRSLETPAGIWAQGFVISRRTVEQYLETSPYPTRFVPDATAGDGDRGPGRIRVPVDGTPWDLELDVSNSLAEAAARVAEDRGRFLRTVLLSAAAAALAGLLVIAMVFQSERLARERAQFSAAAAHELRTPLAGLRLYGEMLAEGLGDPGRARDYARRMAGEAERLGRVVTNVLSFARLERGSVPVHPEPGDLGRVVTEACERQRPALEESGVRVELDLEPDLPTVLFDRDAVANILQNLLDNAEKYTREIEDRAIRVRLFRDARRVFLSVADNGRGISQDLRRRLFRPFARGQHDDASEGLGLGLVLVRKLARAQGGDVRYHDAPAGGAVFTLSLPV